MKAYKFNRIDWVKQWEDNVEEFMATFTVKQGWKMYLQGGSGPCEWLGCYPMNKRDSILDKRMSECYKTARIRIKKDIETILRPGREKYWEEVAMEDVPDTTDYLLYVNGERTLLRTRKVFIDVSEDKYGEFPKGDDSNGL